MSFARASVVCALVVAVAGAAGCVDKRPRTRPVKVGSVSTGTDSLAFARQQLEGTWELASLKTVRDGKLTDVIAMGQMTYDAYGNMAMKGHIVGMESLPASAMLNYEGRAVIDAAKKQLRLVGVVAPDGGAPVTTELSVDKLRQYEFTDQGLAISTMAADGTIVMTAVWKRVK